jgi:hypothetical protein
MPSVDIHAEFVVAATEILDERVPGADYPCQAQPFQTAHRPQPGLQAPMIGFDGIIRVLLSDVGRGALISRERLVMPRSGRNRPLPTCPR